MVVRVPLVHQAGAVLRLARIFRVIVGEKELCLIQSEILGNCGSPILHDLVERRVL